MLLWLALLIFVALQSIMPPAARSANAPADEFSANRALVPLREIAKLPHPQGASEHTRVREYLMAQLRQLGLSPRLQTTPVVGARSYRPYRAGTVHNIWAKIPGKTPTGTLLLAAHYDSVNTGPGASDDGASVAALLETLRALQSTRKTSPGSHFSAINTPSTSFNFRNDVIVLLTDGEETGLLGARAFVEEGTGDRGQGTGEEDSSFILHHSSLPFLVLNFEARGTSGPSLMFETSEGNGWLARQFASGVPQPLGSSLFYAVYKLLPNDTDFTEFRGAGMIGLNFAYLDRVAHYHTSLDSVSHLDLRSLQHQGDNMLGLARRFGSESLTQARQPDVIYFNGARNWLCVYPQTWAVPLAILATLLTLVALAQRWRKSAEPVWRRAVVALSGVAWVGVAVVATTLAMAGLTYWLTSGAASPRMTLYLDDTTFTGVLLLCVGSVLLLLDAKRLPYQKRTKPDSEEGTTAEAQKTGSTATTKNSRDEIAEQNSTAANLPISLTFDAMQMGAILWWLLLTWLTALLLPDGSYLFVWPLLGVLLARWIQGAYLQNRPHKLRSPESMKASASPSPKKAWEKGLGIGGAAGGYLQDKQEMGTNFGVTLLCLLFGATPAILLVIPVLCLLFQTLSIGSLTIIGVVTALTIALLRPQLQVARNIFTGHSQALPLLFAATGTVLLWVGAEVLQPSETNPRSNSLFYALNADTQTALWASNDRKPDAWTIQFLGEHPQRSALPDFLPVSPETFLHAPAPPTPLPPPVATLQEDRIENGVRTLRLLLISPRHAPVMEMAVSSDVRVLNASIEGKPVDGSRDPGHAWSLLYFAVPENGLTLTLRVSPAAPVTLHVIDRSYGLPSIPDKTYAPRPADMIASPASGWYQDTALISKTFRF